MMNNPATFSASTRQSSWLATNKVIRNTYMLLSMTLLFSALTAGVSMTLNLPHPGLLLTIAGYSLLCIFLFIKVDTTAHLVINHKTQPSEHFFL